ncbi:MAG TPA: M48 family metallopeptidase, partial [Kofleriaceae bacterium]|nr:M48 family metallopeptidase [Kofleriaceae bacterium]
PTSAYDRSALATVLLDRGAPADLSRAQPLAMQAAQVLPDDPAIVGVECEIDLSMKDFERLRSCMGHLLDLVPNDMRGNLIAAQLALFDGDPTHASIYLERSKAAGLPDLTYRPLREQIDGLRRPSEPLIDTDRAIAIGVPAVLGWFLLLCVLLVVGNVLSDATVRGIDCDSLRVSPAYRIVLALTAALFYASLPVMVFVVVGGGLLTLYIFDQMGATPLIVLGLVLLAIVGTITAVARTIFAARRFEIEGHRIDPAGYPKLQAMLEEVAAAIGTRAVDTVYFVPGTEIVVTQHRGQRILILGVALFDNMKQRELRSVLAHEYGHFKDAGALSLQATLVRLLKNMAKVGALNPAWWILRAFTHLYLVVSRGASRVQETLADRWAIRAYGSEAFVAAHRHIAARSVEMRVDLDQTIKDVVENHWSLPNFYQYAVERTVTQAQLDAAVAKLLDRAPERFDTHPSTRQRIALAEKLATTPERTSPDDATPVWDLFTDPEQIERTMTAILRERIHKKLGIAISGDDWEDDESP